MLRTARNVRNRRHTARARSWVWARRVKRKRKKKRQKSKEKFSEGKGEMGENGELTTLAMQRPRAFVS